MYKSRPHLFDKLSKIKDLCYMRQRYEQQLVKVELILTIFQNSN